METETHDKTPKTRWWKFVIFFVITSFLLVLLSYSANNHALFTGTLQSRPNDYDNMGATAISSLARQVDAAFTQLQLNESYTDGEMTYEYMFLNSANLSDAGKNVSYESYTDGEMTDEYIFLNSANLSDSSINVSPSTKSNLLVYSSKLDKTETNLSASNISKMIDKYFPALLRRLKPQGLKHTFLPKYKNPCFQEGTRLRCLPYFFLGGAPKCGTTDLWYNLLRHPSIFAGVSKEPHFWKSISKTSPGAGRYLGHFDKVARNVSSSKTRRSMRKKLVVGDGSASTLWTNREIIDRAHVGKKGEIPFVFADVIHEILPKAKFIFILRDPTNRTISDFFAFSKTKSPSFFHNQVVAEISKFNKCLRSRSLRTCVYVYSNSGKDHVRLHVGIYAAHIREWLRVFPEQVLILRTEQWHHHAETNLLSDIFKFLDLEPLREEELPPITSNDKKIMKKRIVTQKGTNRYGDILDKTRQLLNDFFEPYNRELAAFLNDDRFLWKT